MLDPHSKLLCHYDDGMEPFNETRHMKTVAELGLADIESLPVFEEATQTAAHLLEAPICILGLMEPERQLIKSAFGLCRVGLMNELATSRQLPRSESFCSRVVETQKMLILADTRQDEQFAGSRLVQHYGIHAYLGVPLITSQGYCIGTLAVMELAPREFSSRDVDMLELVARWCMSEFERSYLRKQAIADQLTPDSSIPLLSSISIIKGDLISHMAQELRTPLTSILGMASVLNREIYGPLTGKQKEYMDIIHNSGQYLLSVLNEMLELGAMEEGKTALSLTPVDVEMLCQQALSSLQQAAQRQDQQVRLTMGLSSNDRIWLVDKEKIRQMLYHLVLSVIQSASPDSDIRIHVSRRDQSLTMAVSVYHPWLGDGLPQAEYLLHQMNSTALGLYPEMESDRTRVLLEDGLKPPSLSGDAPSEAVKNLPKKSLRFSRQNLELMLCKRLVELHSGELKLQGTSESGYRYFVTIPQLSA